MKFNRTICELILVISVRGVLVMPKYNNSMYKLFEHFIANKIEMSASLPVLQLGQMTC